MAYLASCERPSRSSHLHLGSGLDREKLPVLADFRTSYNGGLDPH